MHENGGGAANLFHPESFNAADLEQITESVNKAAIRAGQFSNEAQMQAHREKLRTDASWRHDRAQTLVTQGLLTPYHMSVGARLYSKQFGSTFLLRTPEGYERWHDKGRLEQWNTAGRLVRIVDRKNNFVALKYNARGELAEMIDNRGRKLRIFYNTAGKVERIVDADGRIASYEYDNRGNLVYTRDVDGYEYRHEYNARFKMTAIRYTDGTSTEIAYHPLDKNENVKSVKERDGTRLELNYDLTSAPGYFTVWVHAFSSEPTPLSQGSFEYVYQRDQRGHEWLQKFIATIDGERTEVEYEDAASVPVVVRKGATEVRLRYDALSHVIARETSDDVIALLYDNHLGKVTEIRRWRKNESPSSQHWSRFVYDVQGNLVSTTSSNGQVVSVEYDNQGRIKTLIEDNERVEFESFTWGGCQCSNIKIKNGRLSLQ